jgi:hypothetical protein
LNDYLQTGPDLLKSFNSKKPEDELLQAAATIVNQHCLGCTDSVKEVVELISDVIEIHSRGGFEIRGFIRCRQANS